MTNFWELVRESTITQAIMTIIVWGTICYMAAQQMVIPEIIQLGGSAILGFWFGTKQTYAAAKSAQSVVNAMAQAKDC